MNTLRDMFCWILSHSPFLCFSNDANFSTITCKDIKECKFRFSFVSLMLGEVIYYYFTYNFKNVDAEGQDQWKLYHKIVLSEYDGLWISDTKLDVLLKKYKSHIDWLAPYDLLIEKEKLLYHINNERHRKDQVIQKINVFTVIAVAIITIALPLIFTKADCIGIKNMNYYSIILVGLIFYSFLNVGLFIFSNIKTTVIKQSSFSDLRNSTEKQKEIAVQYYYDWQQLKYKADLFVSYVANLQNWIVCMVLLLLLLVLELYI